MVLLMFRKVLLILFSFVLLFSCSFALAEEELLINGGFDGEEGALPDEWRSEAWYSGADDMLVELLSEDGNSVLHIVNYIDNDVRLCQTIEVEPNSCYRLSCRIKTDGVDGGAGANVSIVDSLATSSALLGTADWQTVELTGVTGDDQTTLTVAARIGGYGLLSFGEAWFDDFSVVRLDEPPDGAASFSLAEAGSGEAAVEGAMPGAALIVLCTAVSAAALVFVYRKYIRFDGAAELTASRPKYVFVAVCAAAVIVRVLLSVIFYGHPTDIVCFMAWSQLMAEVGPAGFYVSGMFTDYPPGYMYVLWLCGEAAKLFGVAYGSDMYALMVKIPAIIADVAAAIMVYRIAARNKNERVGFVLMLVTLFLPVFMFISGAWGQIDQILSVLLLLSALLIIDDKLIAAGALYGLAILMKPQALMVGPVLAAVYFCKIFDSDKRLKTALKTLLAVLAAVAVIIVLALPFGAGRELTWLTEKYFSTATSYPYASIEAFNLMALCGGNWTSVEAGDFIFSYGTWGTIFIALSVAYPVFLYVIGRKKGSGALLLVAAFELCAIFALGQYMHERYLFPALILLLAAYAVYKDKRLFVAFAMLSTTLLFNVLAAFVIIDNPDARAATYDAMLYIGSAATLISFGYLAYAATDILLRGKCRVAAPPAESAPVNEDDATVLPEPAFSRSPRWKRKDYIAIGVLTAVYAACALINLGTTQAPETYWTASRTDDSVVLDLGEETELSSLKIFGGLYEGELTLLFDDGSTVVFEQENGDMFRWTDALYNAVTTQYITMSVTYGQIWINGLALYDSEGTLLSPALASYGDESALNLIDEREMIPDEPSYLNGMYFDELYHARTAYEHLHGIAPYENSHPPLGKVFIMLGVAVFGMNAFGWRIVGTLFGIAMVPIMYAFGKRLFKRMEYALLAAGLFAFDFMHFTQTRIATIDTYGVFFIILMFYFMYRYYEMNFYDDGLKATLKPLGLAGLFFGFGMASKWIGAYAGLGLAFMLLITLLRRYGEYRAARRGGSEADRERTAHFLSYTVKTLLWCCVFYLAVPCAIYLASYIPYYLSESHYTVLGESNSVLSVQEFMYSYHSGLTAVHDFQSTWYEWPLIFRPIWYYIRYPSDGVASTISAMGSPAVWWPCFIMSALAAIAVFTKRLRLTKRLEAIFIAMAFNFLPWVLITRCTFIYHYFATVPFIILCSVYLLASLERAYPRLKYVKWVWLGLSVAMFILFYPVISGMPVSTEYIRFLEWLPGWTFLGY